MHRITKWSCYFIYFARILPQVNWLASQRADFYTGWGEIKESFNIKNRKQWSTLCWKRVPCWFVVLFPHSLSLPFCNYFFQTPRNFGLIWHLKQCQGKTLCLSVPEGQFLLTKLSMLHGQTFYVNNSLAVKSCGLTLQCGKLPPNA